MESSSAPQAQPAAEKKFRASSAVTLKALSAWEQANLSPWYHPRFWLDLLVHPSKHYTMNHQRRRARLYALVSFCFLIVSIVANGVLSQMGMSDGFIATHAVVNAIVFVSYCLSRTTWSQGGMSLGVFGVWLLPYVNTILTLKASTTASGDVTVTDSINWLFTPSYMLMAAIFLSRSMTVSLVLLDSISLLLLPAIAGVTFFAVRKLLFFHMVLGALLLLASIIAFRDKLQLYSQHDGQSHEDQHGAGSFSRSLLQPHSEITDRIFRRRSRILSAFLLGLIAFTIIWVIVEASGWAGHNDPVVVSLAVLMCVASCILYALSRSQHTRWASRVTLFMLLVLPYIYYAGAKTTVSDQMYVNLLSTSSAAILGVALFSGPELVALAAIIFFPTIYSPIFPPHVISSLILLVSSFIYRRDIKEIHDTAVYRDDLYEDEAHDLLVPWERRYFFGLLTYIQMVSAYYAVAFSFLLALGLGAMIASVSSKEPTDKLVKVTLGAAGSPGAYVIYVTTGDCASRLGQTYTVRGEHGMFEISTPEYLIANSTSNRVPVVIDGNHQIGAVTAVSFKFDGQFDVTQNEGCVVERIDVWRPSTQIVFSTSTFAVDPSEDPQPSSRRLLHFRRRGRPQDRDRRNYGWNCGRSLRERRQAICEAWQKRSKRGRTPVVWDVNSCICGHQPQVITDAFVCLDSNVTSCSSQDNCCSGHGECNVETDPDTNLKTASCECAPGWTGDSCDTMVANVCGYQTTGTDPVIRDYEGLCQFTEAYGGQPDTGALYNYMTRPGKNNYNNKINTYTNLTDSVVTAFVNGLPAAAVASQNQNQFYVAVLQLALQDVAQPDILDFSGQGEFPLEFTNNQTLFLDLSPIYGTDPDNIPRVGRNVAYPAGFDATTPIGVAIRFFVDYHNWAASRLYLSVTATWRGGTIDRTAYATNDALVFEAARFATVLFYQRVLDEDVIPAARNFNTPTSGTDYPSWKLALGTTTSLVTAVDLTPTLQANVVAPTTWDYSTCTTAQQNHTAAHTRLFALFNTKAGKFGTKSAVTGFNAKIKAAWNKNRFFGLAPYANLSQAILSVTTGTGDFFQGVHSSTIAPFPTAGKSDFTQLAFATTAGLLQYALANDKHYKRIDDVSAVAEFPDRNPFTVVTGLTSGTYSANCPSYSVSQRRSNLATLFPACEIYDTLFVAGSQSTGYNALLPVVKRLQRDILSTTGTPAVPILSPDRFYELGSLTALTCLAQGLDANGDFLTNAAIDFTLAQCHCPIA